MRLSVSFKTVIGLSTIVVALMLVGFFSLRSAPQATTQESDGDDSARATTLTSKTPEPNKNPEPAEPPPDRTIKELVRTWNQGKAEDIAGMFLSDGSLVIPTGSELRSRDEIAKTISEKRAGLLKETILSNTVEKVSRLDPETAVVQGTYKLDGIKIMGFSTSATGSYVLRQIKREGRWLISRAEITKGGNG
jgi:uncharacterized protein (TIGR02246 family)